MTSSEISAGNPRPEIHALSQGTQSMRRISSWSGSWIFAILSLVAVVVALITTREDIKAQLTERWQVMLLILWLVFGSTLIKWGYAKAREFQNQARAVLSGIECPTGAVPIWSDQENRLQSRAVFKVLFPFVIGGLILVALVNEPSLYWKLCWALAIGSTLYYGAFGIWGAWVVTRGVAEFARDVLVHDRMMLFHGDRLAGLGFAVRYADVASILMLTGVFALPMGTHLGLQCVKMNNPVGQAMALLAAMLICVWAIFTLISSLRGRAAVAGALDRYRIPLLNQIANQKRAVMDNSGSQEEFNRLEIREKAALRLRTGIFSGAGGWKDLIGVVASAGALAKFINDVQLALPAP